MEVVGHVLLSGTTTAAILAVIATVLLLHAGHKEMRSPYWYPMTFWTAHLSVFFVSNVIVRVFFDYTLPTVLFSGWGVIIYLQALVSIIGVTLVKLTMDRT